MKAVGAALVTAHDTGDIGAEIRYTAAIGIALAFRQLNDQAISCLDSEAGIIAVQSACSAFASAPDINLCPYK
jgi:hypothetical protein